MQQAAVPGVAILVPATLVVPRHILLQHSTLAGRCSSGTPQGMPLCISSFSTEVLPVFLRLLPSCSSLQEMRQSFNKKAAQHADGSSVEEENGRVAPLLLTPHFVAHLADSQRGRHASLAHQPQQCKQHRCASHDMMISCSAVYAEAEASTVSLKITLNHLQPTTRHVFGGSHKCEAVSALPADGAAHL
eukprot:1157151-Pelagomonas_calceolata.AAC.7